MWLASIIAVSCVAIRENVGDKFRDEAQASIEQVFRSEIVIDGDTTTLERLLEDYDDESVIEEGRKTLHIAVPSKSIDITVDKKPGEACGSTPTAGRSRSKPPRPTTKPR